MNGNGNGKKFTINLATFIMALVAVASGAWALSATLDTYRFTMIEGQLITNKEHIMALESESRKYALDIQDVKKDISHIREAVDTLVNNHD